mgnify:CR=1 FL=1
MIQEAHTLSTLRARVPTWFCWSVAAVRANDASGADGLPSSCFGRFDGC